MAEPSFEWDGRKDAENQTKHGVPFVLAQHAFADPHRVIAEDTMHSTKERRYFCFGRVAGARSDRSIHAPHGRGSHFWCRLLAQGKGHL